MANARPVIATSVGGVEDLVGPSIYDEGFKVCERGVCVPPGDAKLFAAALHKLVNDFRLRNELAQRGYEFVQAKYPKERLLTDIRNLYTELLNQRTQQVEARVSVVNR
jgi:glycosyltransferase involved in cell wall biosynthesis